MWTGRKWVSSYQHLKSGGWHAIYYASQFTASYYWRIQREIKSYSSMILSPVSINGDTYLGVGLPSEPAPSRLNM